MRCGLPSGLSIKRPKRPQPLTRAGSGGFRPGSAAIPKIGFRQDEDHFPSLIYRLRFIQILFESNRLFSERRSFLLCVRHLRPLLWPVDIRLTRQVEKPLTVSTVTRSNSSVGHKVEAGQRGVMRGIGINVSPVVGPVARI